MMAMVREINERHLPSLDGRIDASLRVTCASCPAGRLDPRPLSDLLESVYETDGIDATIARYQELRERYYGGDAYDFRPQVLVGLATALADQGAMDDAIELAATNADANPEAKWTRGAWLELVLEQTLDAEGVDQSLKKLNELAPTLPEETIGPGLLNSLGWRLNRTEREAKGHAILEANHARFPEEYEPLESLAFIRASSGRAEEAFALLEGWLVTHPDHDRARHLLVNLREKHGQ